MKCYKCNANISDTCKYCPRCDTLFDNDDVEHIANSLESQLLNIYFNKMWYRSNISVGYLLFNFWYALYRKMYFEALISAIMDGLLINLIGNWQFYIMESMGFNALLIVFLFMVTIVVNIYYLFKLDEIYIDKAKVKIAKLVKEYGSDNVELLTTKCKNDSKGNVVAVIVPAIIIILLVFILYTHQFYI